MILEEYNQDLQTHHLNEPQRRWGSTWTDEKLDAFEKYVKAYLTILNKFKRQFANHREKKKDHEEVDLN